MSTITKKVWLCETDYGMQVVCGVDMADMGYITLATAEVTFKIPDDFNMVAAKVAVIDKRIESTREEFGRRLGQLQDAKAKLLCLENGVTT